MHYDHLNCFWIFLTLFYCLLLALILQVLSLTLLITCFRTNAIAFPNKWFFFLIQFILQTFGVILRFLINFIDKIEIYNIFSVSMIDINGREGTKMKVVEADFRTLWTLGAKLNFTLGLMESWFGNGWTTVSVLWSFLTYFLIVFLYSVHIFCSLIFQTIVSRKVTANDGKRFFL
jgi:hypothetical protein